MNILVLTKSEWSNENSVGNTFTNLLSKVDSNQLANFYCKNSKPQNSVCINYYSVSELGIIKSFLNPRIKPGNSFTHFERDENIERSNITKTENKLYNFFRGKENILALILQNLIWRANKWNNENLDSFLEGFEPDIIFAPGFQNIHMNRILLELKRKTKAKVVLFHMDDYFYDEYSKRNIISNYLYKKRNHAIETSIGISSLNYCISHKQQEEYSERFNTNMKLLFKGGNFDKRAPYNLPSSKVVNLVYVGALHYGRWKTLALLVNKINEANKNNDIKFFLSIYSQYELSDEVLKSLEIPTVSKFFGKIPANEVEKKLIDSDIVLHIESFEEIEKKLTRLSFSTKIVDCLESGRTIFAIGDQESASINYLSKDNIALVAHSEDEIYFRLKEIQHDISILEKYSQKAWRLRK